jgi:hypothetical protein
MFANKCKYVAYTRDDVLGDNPVSLYVYSGQSPEYIKVDKVLYEAVPLPDPCCKTCKKPYVDDEDFYEYN